MPYALITLWHERQRYLPAVLAVAFSALLIAMQFGLMLGLFAISSITVDRSRADLWVGSPEFPSVDLGRPIPESFVSRVASDPDVQSVELFAQGFAPWKNSKGNSELCMVVGSRLEDGAIGSVKELTPELRSLLSEPGAVVIDETEQSRLGVSGIGDTADIAGQRVRVVGFVHGFKAPAAPFIFCSMRTARPLLRLKNDETIYIIAKCKDRAAADQVAERLHGYGKMAAFSSEALSLRSRVYWLTKTKSGVALGYAALLGLVVGGVVTSQTLYAATAASLREYAVLRALGIPRWRMALSALAQAFWVGLAGIAIGLPATFALAQGGEALGVRVLLPWWLLTATVVVTMTMAILSGLLALRSLRLIEPAVLLR
jgi:putative ABC transport system permease protein